MPAAGAGSARPVPAVRHRAASHPRPRPARPHGRGRRRWGSQTGLGWPPPAARCPKAPARPVPASRSRPPGRPGRRKSAAPPGQVPAPSRTAADMPRSSKRATHARLQAIVVPVAAKYRPSRRRRGKKSCCWPSEYVCAEEPGTSIVSRVTGPAQRPASARGRNGPPAAGRFHHAAAVPVITARIASCSSPRRPITTSSPAGASSGPPGPVVVALDALAHAPAPRAASACRRPRGSP